MTKMTTATPPAPAPSRWRPVDPGWAGLKGAVRVAIVTPAVFALARLVISDPIMALFAAFGSMAMLMFVDFGGPARVRFGSYIVLVLAGLLLITLGTLCSGHPLLGTGAMALIGFTVLATGVINGYFAAAAPAALLAFVVPVMIPATASALPSRLAGWLLGGSASIIAVAALWPTRPHGRLRADVAAACRALADCVEAGRPGAAPEPAPDADGARAGDAADHAEDTEDTEDGSGGARTDAVRAAVARVRTRFLAVPYRPTGMTGPTAALAHLVNDIGWLGSFAAPHSGRPVPDSGNTFPAETGEIVSGVVEVLRTSAARVTRRSGEPDLERLDLAREAVGRALGHRIAVAIARRDDSALAETVDAAFRLRALSYGARQIAVDALLASGTTADHQVPPEPVPGRAHGALSAAKRLTAGYASTRSVWFRNSLRAAVGLALAVFVGHLSGLDNSFWLVLGTLSVLRSNALNTASTVLRALAGTAAGILVGGVLIALIGTDPVAMWAVLPVAVLVAAYTPRVVSFAAGQAAFTVAVLVLFALIHRSGWQIGLTRLTDIAVGCAISLVVGVALWPRGATAIMRDAVATAYRRATRYLSATVDGLLDGDPDRIARAERDALAAGFQLDDAFRNYLAERSSDPATIDSLSCLVWGAIRIRQTGHVLRTGHPLCRLRPMQDASPSLRECRSLLGSEIASLHSWFLELTDAVLAASPPPPPRPAHRSTSRQVLRRVREMATAGQPREVPIGLGIAWANEHLQALTALQSPLAHAAGQLAER